MAKTGNEKLAEALTEVSQYSVNNIVNFKAIKGAQRTLLIKAGYLKPIIRGWYLFDADIITNKAGESALWFESIWHFLGQYLFASYGQSYWLNPEASLDLITANNALPKQLIVFNSINKQKIVELPNNMSLLVLPSKTIPMGITEIHGTRVLKLEVALASLAPSIYQQNPISAQLAIELSDINAVAKALLTLNNVASGNRLIGAYKALGRKADSRKLETIMKSVGFSAVKAENPFAAPIFNIGLSQHRNSASMRIKILWEKFRGDVEKVFEKKTCEHNFFAAPITECLHRIDTLYVTDAYHSLSIEGYIVTPELIEKVAHGDWSPLSIENDNKQKDALAAKGYYDAFQKVKALLKEVHEEGKDNLDLHYLIDISLTEIVTSLFSPCVNAGLIKPQDLVGYRQGSIMIRQSKHIPPASDNLMDCMDVLKELIADEKNYAVKAILGHFFLGFIHPFPDGNGRTSRFIMNLLFLLGGYSWTVILVTKRSEYLDALEQASVYANITPFAEFLANSMIEQQTKSLSSFSAL